MGTVAIVGVAAAVVVVEALWFWRPWELSGTRLHVNGNQPSPFCTSRTRQAIVADWMRTGSPTRW
jgi:hypothetical protein